MVTLPDALHSIFCWSICQPFQGCDSSWICLWGWWKRFCLRTLNAFTHKPVSFAVLNLLMLISIIDASQWTVLWDSLQRDKIWGIKQPAMNQYFSILLHITCIWCNIVLGITQYYSILHGHYNITQYYMRIG